MRSHHWLLELVKHEMILEQLKVRNIEFRNRIGLAPMSLYFAEHGYLSDWHFVHYAARAQGTGLVIVEATAVSPEGRVTPYDLGIWSDDFIPSLKKLTAFIHSQGAAAGLQLSHGGRKASRSRPWEGNSFLSPKKGGWQIVAPSPIPFAEGYPTPTEASLREIGRIQEDFVRATERAHLAGFKFLELHAGHGRLLHSFYSPISNKRSDEYGGSYENRVKFLVQVVQKVRAVWPDEYPLAVRLSCVDWVDGGWQLEDSVRLAIILQNHGVDLIDCTSGGIISPIRKPVSPGYQVPFAREIKRRSHILTAAVGLITNSAHADQIVVENSADVILFGRKMILQPHFALQVGLELNSAVSFFPMPYQKAISSLKNGTDEHTPEL